MKQIALEDTTKWAKEYRSRWKKYLYGLVGAEISTTTEFCDECVQISPEKYDTGLLFESIVCQAKSVVDEISEIKNHHDDKQKRYAFLVNGNFNYLSDIQSQLQELYEKLSRHSRLFIVVYNPFIGFFYNLASWIGIRKAPTPDVYLTEKDLQTLAKLTHYEIVRIRPSVFLPFYIPLIESVA